MCHPLILVVQKPRRPRAHHCPFLAARGAQWRRTLQIAATHLKIVVDFAPDAGERHRHVRIDFNPHGVFVSLVLLARIFLGQPLLCLGSILHLRHCVSRLARPTVVAVRSVLVQCQNVEKNETSANFLSAPDIFSSSAVGLLWRRLFSWFQFGLSLGLVVTLRAVDIPNGRKRFSWHAICLNARLGISIPSDHAVLDASRPLDRARERRTETPAQRVASTVAVSAATSPPS
jgi:hypothetical protein